MGAEERISFDSSGLDATINYLRHRTGDNFRALVASRGNDFAFRHYRWSKRMILRYMISSVGGLSVSDMSRGVTWRR